MDEQLQARIEEAKAAGYSDEEIQKYLQTKDQPLPAEKPIDRTEEYKGMATAIAPDALVTGAEIGAAGYAGKKLLNAWRGAPAAGQAPTAGSPSNILSRFATPNAPVAPTVNPAVSPSYAAPSAPAQAAAGESPLMTHARNIVQKIALDKVIKGSIGVGALLHSPSLNANEDEELRKRRQQGFNPNGALGATSGY